MSRTLPLLSGRSRRSVSNNTEDTMAELLLFVFNIQCPPTGGLCQRTCGLYIKSVLCLVGRHR